MSAWTKDWADSKLGACVKLAANIAIVSHVYKLPKLGVVVGGHYGALFWRRALIAEAEKERQGKGVARMAEETLETPASLILRPAVEIVGCEDLDVGRTREVIGNIFSFHEGHNGESIRLFAGVDFMVSVRKDKESALPAIEVRLPECVEPYLKSRTILVNSPPVILIQTIRILRSIHHLVATKKETNRATVCGEHQRNALVKSNQVTVDLNFQGDPHWYTLVLLGLLHHLVEPYFHKPKVSVLSKFLLAERDAPNWTKISFGPDVVHATVHCMLGSRETEEIHAWIEKVGEGMENELDAMRNLPKEQRVWEFTFEENLKALRYFVGEFAHNHRDQDEPNHKLDFTKIVGYHSSYPFNPHVPVARGSPNVPDHQWQERLHNASLLY